MHVFTVTAAGEIVGGPEGWTAELIGLTYTVSHGEVEALLPMLQAVAGPAIDNPPTARVAMLTEVGANGFSWQCFRESFGAGDVFGDTIVHCPEAAE